MFLTFQPLSCSALYRARQPAQWKALSSPTGSWVPRTQGRLPRMQLRLLPLPSCQPLRPRAGHPLWHRYCRDPHAPCRDPVHGPWGPNCQRGCVPSRGPGGVTDFPKGKPTQGGDTQADPTSHVCSQGLKSPASRTPETTAQLVWAWLSTRWSTSPAAPVRLLSTGFLLTFLRTCT